MFGHGFYYVWGGTCAQCAGSLAENVFLVARLSNLGQNLTKHVVSNHLHIVAKALVILLASSLGLAR